MIAPQGHVFLIDRIPHSMNLVPDAGGINGLAKEAPALIRA